MYERRRVRAVYDQIMKHPISNIFNKPIEQAKADMKTAVSKPMDLAIIGRRIKDENYTLKKFERDMNLIVSNTVRHFAKDSLYPQCAQELKKLFVHLALNTRVSWAERANKLRKRIGKQILEKPSLVRGSLVFPDKTWNLQDPMISRKEIESFIKATQRLTDRKDQNEMISIVETMEPNLKSRNMNLKIDVVELQPSTLKALVEYAKKACKKQGIPYEE